MPLQRRLPKRGFTNIFRTEYAVVNLDQLDAFPAGSEVTLEALLEKRILRKPLGGLKVLARGDISRAVIVKAAACSKQAKQKIEAAGGRVEVVRG